LLEALDDASPLQDDLFVQLTPDDFAEGEARDEFSRRRDHWLAERSRTAARNPYRPPCAKPSHAAEPMAERFVRLQGAIRIAEAAPAALAAMSADLANFDQALEELSVEVRAQLRRLGLLRAAPEVWEDSRTGLLKAIGRVEERYRVSGSDLGWAGLSEIHRVAGPLQPGCLYLLGSAPGDGKTAFLAMLARAYSVSENRCGFLALRDTTQSLVLRMLYGQGCVGPELIASGSWPIATHGKFMEGAAQLSECFPSAAQCREIGSGALCELARSLVASKQLEVLFVDDLGFVLQGPESSAGHAGLSRSIASLRQLAVEMQIPVVASVGLDVADTSAGAATTAANLLRFACMDFFAVLTASRNTDGDVVHQFEVLRNSFGPPVTLPLVYQRTHHRFFPLSTEVVDE